MNKLRIVFAGTSHFSEEHLNALIHSSHEIITILTQPDKKSGRGQKIHFSPVKKTSIKYSIPLLQPLTLKTQEIQNILYNLKAD
ncbi:MAG: formyltransferase family protein, partial [Buchnera aphidicola]|nr:formyltransferase family protein [Buchnera aphidicola]